jgi:nucleoside-diphosphate-sugar epimerase
MNTYGPGDTHRSRLVPRALSLLAAGEPYDFGDRDDGSTRLDFLYVGDMAGAYLATAEHLERAPGDVFNFGSGRCTGIREVAVLTSQIYDGVDREPIFHGTPRRPSKQKWLDISRARSVLGWRPTVDLDEGLTHTVRWHRERNGRP